MNDLLIEIRDKIAEVLDCVGDIESDIEGLDAMADHITPRPAIAVVNDLAELCGELRDATSLNGRPLTDVLNDLINAETTTSEDAQ